MATTIPLSIPSSSNYASTLLSHQPPNPLPKPIPPSPEPPPLPPSLQPPLPPSPEPPPAPPTVPPLLSPVPPTPPSANPPPKPIPPTPDPPPTASNPSHSPDPPLPNDKSNPNPLPKHKWSTLFSSKPMNAGSFEANDIELKFEGENLVSTDDIIQASIEQWSGFLVGFFLDSPLPFTTVVNILKSRWSPQGAVEFKTNGSVFFFQFSSLADRIRVLEADPVIIRNKLFIVKPWQPSLSNVANSVRVVPVWIKMYNIPLVAWSKRGISWMATRVGKFLCMDSNTESLKRLEFAKCMVEVSSDSPLPDAFPVRNLDGSIQMVKVLYLWKPELCILCKVFGHSSEKCQSRTEMVSEQIDNGASNCENTMKHNGEKGNVDESRVNTQANMNDMPRSVLQRSHYNAATRWTKVVKRKNPVRFVVSGKQKGKQVLIDASSPDGNVVGTSNRFSALPECDIVSNGYKINYDIEEGEIESEDTNEVEQSGHTEENVICGVVNGSTLQQQSDTLQVKNKERPNLENKTQARQIAMVDDFLSLAFGSPSDSSKKGPCKINNVDGETVGIPIENQKTTNSDGEPAISVVPIRKATVVSKTNSNSEKQFQDDSPKTSAIESARSVHIRTINADIATISISLQDELAGREVNSPEYFVTKKKMENFSSFCSGIVFDQLHTAQLDSVSTVLQRTIASGKKKTRDSPTVKDKSTNPYAHIEPPSAYKARPPDIITDQVTSSSNEKAGPKTHVTRSVKKEMLRNLKENG